jgi:hypothetical protein
MVAADAKMARCQRHSRFRRGAGPLAALGPGGKITLCSQTNGTGLLTPGIPSRARLGEFGADKTGQDRPRPWRWSGPSGTASTALGREMPSMRKSTAGPRRIPWGLGVPGPGWLEQWGVRPPPFAHRCYGYAGLGAERVYPPARRSRYPGFFALPFLHHSGFSVPPPLHC